INRPIFLGVLIPENELQRCNAATLNCILPSSLWCFAVVSLVLCRRQLKTIVGHPFHEDTPFRNLLKHSNFCGHEGKIERNAYLGVFS
ncbi:MAG: hypothetical protein J6Y38_02205, partial [Bacteroidaceae bacterium]|nr:hypothetical protein [Bacteroidaceae bacterium]